MAIEVSCYKTADLVSSLVAARTNELDEIKRAVKRLEATIASRSSENDTTQASGVRNNEDVLETQVDEDELTELLRGDDDHESVGGDDESLLAEIYEGMGEQRASDPVTDRLAKIVEKKCSAPVLGPEDAQAAIEKFPRPGNKGRPAGSVSFLLIRAYKQVSPPMLEDGREPIPHLGSANASVQAGAHSLDSFRAGGLGQGTVAPNRHGTNGHGTNTHVTKTLCARLLAATAQMSTAQKPTANEQRR